jgi:hypothetical protein
MSHFQAPIYRALTMKSFLVTLDTTFGLTSGILGTNGNLSQINWNFFKDYGSFANLFRYVEISSYRLQVTLSTTAVALDSFNELVVAFYPINYETEAFPTTVPSDSRPLMVLPGVINCQPGAKNLGRWFPCPFKQVFAASDMFSATLNRNCGTLLWYCDDVGTSETVGFVNIQVNLKFYDREYLAANPAPSLVAVKSERARDRIDVIVE